LAIILLPPCVLSPFLMHGKWEIKHEEEEEEEEI
jgi:hypothetical protein